jgi:hypothetical protein
MKPAAAAGDVGHAGGSGDVTEAPPEAAEVVETSPEPGNVAGSCEAPPEASEPKDPGSKSGRKGRRKGGRA